MGNGAINQGNRPAWPYCLGFVTRICVLCVYYHYCFSCRSPFDQFWFLCDVDQHVNVRRGIQNYLWLRMCIQHCERLLVGSIVLCGKLCLPMCVCVCVCVCAACVVVFIAWIFLWIVHVRKLSNTFWFCMVTMALLHGDADDLPENRLGMLSHTIMFTATALGLGISMCGMKSCLNPMSPRWPSRLDIMMNKHVIIQLTTFKIHSTALK